MANRLAKETSPYLQQHAENPVDWFPWDDEALSKAREEDKPILLSIGYSACHWCHVMERESFEDEGTAALMNQHFVNIKVDREERPDLDSIYMRALQATMGRGGWPLTAFLTPDGRFFYGGTYFPPEPRFGMPSFKQVLATISSAFRTRRQEIEEGSDKLLGVLRGTPPGVGRIPEDREPSISSGGRGGEGVENLLQKEGPGLLDQAARYLASQFDPTHGGFGPAPKFPQPVTLEFLLRYHDRTSDPKALEMVLTTLRCMGRGGMRDHLGGGFHRYSVDERWLVPHFEKMLYDNGLLARIYLHAFQITRDPEFRDFVTSTLDYLLTDLRDPAGGFYSARDADSEGEEGLFYIWRPNEVNSVIGEEEAGLFCRSYDVTESGNFEGQNILHLPRSFDSLSESAGVPVEEIRERLEQSREALRIEREGREHPFRDEKVLVSWNSFVLRSLAEAALALDRPDYLEAALETAGFLLEFLRKDGRLLRSWKDGKSKIPAFLEDYAGLGNALLTLYEATLDPRWLSEGRDLANQVVNLFWEEEEGLFFDSAKDGERLVVRPREAMDNATPSGNSMAVELLLRTSSFFGSDDHRRIAVRALLAEFEAASRFPSAFGRFLSATATALTPPTEVVILGDPKSEEMAEWLSITYQRYLPAKVVAGGNPANLPSLPLLEGREPADGRPVAYVCKDFTCSLPLTDSEELAAELERATGTTRG